MTCDLKNWQTLVNTSAGHYSYRVNLVTFLISHCPNSKIANCKTQVLIIKQLLRASPVNSKYILTIPQDLLEKFSKGQAYEMFNETS